MIVSALLFALQSASVAQDSTYTSPALSSLVASAARANHAVPQTLSGYRAHIESEIALLVNNPSGPDGVSGTTAATTEAAAQIEQFQLDVSWKRSGLFDQRMIGYRARQLGPMFSALTIVPRPWTAPTLYGDRMSLMFGGGPSFGTPDSLRRQMPSVHPFAADRERYYRFSGGDTVAKIRSGTRIVPVVRVDVEPREGKHDAILFAGQVFVNAANGEIVRMRGRIKLMAPPSESRLTKLVRFIGRVDEIAYIDFENSERDGQYWLPRRQRIEYQVNTALTESRATIRIQSVWNDVALETTPVGSTDVDTLGAPKYTFSIASSDSTSKWDAWSKDLGAQSSDVSARDFDDVAPPALRPDGSAQWRWQARGFTDLVRYNRVEGVFVGMAGLLDFRDAAPGLAIRAFGGWAFNERTAKGGIELTRVAQPWITSVRAERQLASTNDLTVTTGASGGNIVASLFGAEDNDWVDRRIVSAGVSREFGVKHSSALRLEVARGTDHGFSDILPHGLIGGDFRANRPVVNGSYVRSRAQFDLGRNIVTSSLASGIGASLSYERGDGELAWQRSQIESLLQRTFGRFVLGARTDAAYVAGNHLPTQQLLEVGGAEGLPGYDYKEFAGDQAVVIRTTAAYLMPLLQSPIRISRLVLPAIAPQLQVGFFGGQATARDATRAQLAALGWKTTEGFKGSVDVRLRFFSGAFSVGAARAFDRKDRWKALFALGGSL